MDLVITADTSTAHLAATLGKNTWIILPFLSDWRWFLKNQTANGIKTLNFSGQKIGDLDSAFKSVKKDLKQGLF